MQGVAALLVDPPRAAAGCDASTSMLASGRRSGSCRTRKYEPIAAHGLHPSCSMPQHVYPLLERLVYIGVVVGSPPPPRPAVFHSAAVPFPQCYFVRQLAHCAAQHYLTTNK